jgi:hypothetical protein
MSQALVRCEGSAQLGTLYGLQKILTDELKLIEVEIQILEAELNG